MELSSLPDVPLLEVLAHLPTKQLLRARAVCRRWRDLALHPSVWRHRRLHLSCGPRELGCCAAVLSLAPCLGSLSLSKRVLQLFDEELAAAGAERGRSSTNLAHRRELIRLCRAGTSCAAAELSLELPFDGTSLTPVEILQHQAGLPDSRLRSVTVTIYHAIEDCFSEEETDSEAENEDSGEAAGATAALLELFRTLRRVSIQELRVSTRKPLPGWPESAFLPRASDAAPASLRRLEYEMRSWPDPLLQCLLDAHARTLEAVLLHGSQFTAFPSALLAGCPKLREVCCPLFTAIGELSRCRNISKITLDMHEDTHPGPLLLFLKSATWLKALCFNIIQIWRATNVVSDHVVDLLVGLGESGQSALESLSLFNLEGLDDTRDDLFWQRLADALRGLPKLSHLRISTKKSLPAPPSFLEAITPPSAPSLRTLVMKEAALPCPKTHIHFPEGHVSARKYLKVLQGVVRRNPDLHVEGLSLSRKCRYSMDSDSESCYRFSSDSEDFDVCACWDDMCVPELAGMPSRTEFTLCGHPESVPCGRGSRFQIRL